MPKFSRNSLTFHRLGESYHDEHCAMCFPFFLLISGDPPCCPDNTNVQSAGWVKGGLSRQSR